MKCCEIRPRCKPIGFNVSVIVDFLLDLAGHLTTRRGPDVARGRTLCTTDLQSKEKLLPFYNNGCPYKPYCQFGLFCQLFNWLHKFGAHLKKMIIVTYNSF